MLCWFDVFLRLQKLYPRFVYAQFGQYTPDDSPSNSIERMWATESKKLRGLFLSALAEGDSAPPSLLKLPPAAKKTKFFEVLDKAISICKERLESTLSLKGIQRSYSYVPLDSEGDLHAYYAELMEFQYTCI
jgi:hypothetical protein